MRKKGVQRQHQSALYQQLTQLRRDRRSEDIVCGTVMEFVRPWQEKEPEFVKYFVEHYAGRQQEWAVCYRDNSIPDTTAHAEAFHNFLKRVYPPTQSLYANVA